MMQQEDSFSDEYSIDDEYSPIQFGDNDQENQKFIGEKDIAKLNLSPQTMEYFKNYKDSKNTSKSKFMKLFAFKQEVQDNKSVCAKPIERGQTIAECYDCATDNTCIQCMQCFKNSNHQGHKVVIKKAYGGCCDCGDHEAWKKQGFCKKHTGELIQIQIDAKQSDQFLTEMKQIFFILFRQCIQENRNFARDFSNQLLTNLTYMNEKGVYYNKLTCLLFSSQIAPQCIVSKNVNSRSILGNLLSPKVARYLAMDSWMDLFFSMFQYYPFKKLLLKTYMNNFSIIYGQEDGIQRGSSISCQLLTSHQLVRDYATDETSIPMGSDIRMDKLGSFDSTFLMLYHDLNYITKLQGDTPMVYFKFHTKNKQGLLKLFEYRKVIKSEQDKQKDESEILQLARFVKYFQLQFKALDLLTKVAGILQKDKEHLLFIIKTLYEESLQEESERKMIIFKPLTRALGIFLFAYFDLQIKNFEYSKNKEQIDSLFVYLGGNEGGTFGNNIAKIFKTCAESHLFHAKILAESGLNSTLYSYIYFYKIKSRIPCSLDALNIKIFSLMHTWPQVNRQPILSPQDYIWQSIVVEQNSSQNQDAQIKLKNLQFLLMELNIVTASETNELFMAYQINPQCGLYKGYIENLLLKLLRQQKGNITLSDAKQYAEWFFHPNVDIAQNYLKKFCTYDKLKKAFILNNPQDKTQQPIELVDYKDFRCNLTNKSDFQSPQMTLDLIKQSGTERIYDNLWTIESIKKFILKIVQQSKPIIQAQTTQVNTQLSSTLVTKLQPIFNELMKIVYLKKQTTSKPEQLQSVLEFIKKIDHIDQILHPFYEKFLQSNKMQEEKPSSQGNLPSQKILLSPQKQQLKRIKSNEQQRKKKLKEKMEQKKKALKQKYAKQTQLFEEEEKQKLEKQELEEMTQHKLNCIICKNDDQESLVFPVHITYKNHEKLLGLGEGVTCLSLSSCYHAIDYACYKKLTSELSLKHRLMIKCPFCKTKSNTFLPIKATSKFVPDALDSFEGALFTEKNFNEISILEEIVKSFYHFAILAYLDPQKTLHRRFRIYKILFEILKQNTQSNYLYKVYDKFVTNTMNLNPKVFEQSSEKKRSERLMELGIELQNNSDIQLDDLSESQVEHLLSIIYHEEDMDEESESSQSNGTNLLMRAVNNLKEKFTKNKNNKQQETEKPQNKMTFIFKQVMKRLFEHLNIKSMEEKVQKMSSEKTVEEKEQKPSIQQQRQKMQQQLPHSIDLCFKRLFDPKFVNHHNNIYEDLNDNNNLLKIRDLPINFKPLGLCNKCQCCGEISSSMTVCLLCDWQGCLRNCLAKKKQQNADKSKQCGTFNHSKVHGEQSLFLILQNCVVANITAQGQSTSMGCIYRDEWGNDFNRKQAWQKFFLDEGELSKARVGFLHDQ